MYDNSTAVSNIIYIYMCLFVVHINCSNLKDPIYGNENDVHHD